MAKKVHDSESWTGAQPKPDIVPSREERLIKQQGRWMYEAEVRERAGRPPIRQVGVLTKGFLFLALGPGCLLLAYALRDWANTPGGSSNPFGGRETPVFLLTMSGLAICIAVVLSMLWKLGRMLGIRAFPNWFDADRYPIVSGMIFLVFVAAAAALTLFFLNGLP